MDEALDIVTSQLHGKLRVSVAKDVWKAPIGDIKWAALLKPTTTKIFKVSECISNLARIRNPLAKVSFEELANNLILAKFTSQEDLTSILDVGHWSYLGSLVLSKVWVPGLDLKHLEFNKVDLWLQIHNLPIEMVKSNLALEFAGHAGKVIKEFHFKGPSAKRIYARFRVEVSLNEPLCPEFYMDLEEGDSI